MDFQPSDVDDVRRALAVRAEDARSDPSKFVAFVHRTEKKDGELVFGSKEPHPLDLCVVPPHQRLVLDFVLAHKLCVLMLPAEHGKTSTTAMLGLFLTGQDPSLRGAVVSDAWSQAKKVLGVVKEYIEEPELADRTRAVFPDLKPSSRKGDPWTQGEIVVERPAGIRDPTLVAMGSDGPIMGTRLDWALVDDILTFDNVLTKEGREKVIQWFFAGPVRACGRKGRVVVTNTPYHPEDLLHFLRDKKGWPTLRMDVWGNVWVYNTDFGTAEQPGADQLRDTDPKVDGPNAAPGACRLTGNDHEPSGRQTLWPDAADEERVDKDFRTNIRFAQLYATLTRDDETAVCKQEYVDRCYEEARKVGAHRLVGGWHPEREGGLTFTGIDLAFSKESSADFTAFVTFVVLPSGKKRILDVDSARISGPEVVRRIFAKFKAYDSILVVENNACFVPGTMVLTKSGYVPIEEVKPGNEVWTHAARWRKVTERLEGEARKVVTATTVGSIPVKVTPNHWFYMKLASRGPGRGDGRKRTSGKPDWISCAFVDEPSYTKLAEPKWGDVPANLEVPGTRTSPPRAVVVDEEVALLLGLYVAEGHTTKGQVFLTLGKDETYLAEFAARVFNRLAGRRASKVVRSGSVTRVRVCSTALARTFSTFGKSSTKGLPLPWTSWPEPIRLAIVRGWLLGDGCYRFNNGSTRNPRKFFSGSTISRNWLLWLRTALLAARFRPSVSLDASRSESNFGGRKVRRRPIYALRLNAEDSCKLGGLMTFREERLRWGEIPKSARRSNSPIVFDEDGAWATFKGNGEALDHVEPGGVVYNLVVEEDESFVAEDVVVHNAQDLVRQWALELDISLPIIGHTTGRAKANPDYGLPAIFTEMANGAWQFPQQSDGRVDPRMLKLVEACLHYVPTAHTADELMALYVAWAEARKFGVPGPPGKGGGISSVMSR